MTFNIGLSKKDKRIAHWKEIKSRVTTHEGEALSGREGRKYQEEWSHKYLKRNMTRPTDFNSPEYQKELSKNR